MFGNFRTGLLCDTVFNIIHHPRTIRDESNVNVLYQAAVHPQIFD